MEEDPARVEEGECGLLAGTEGGDEAEEEADGKDEDAESDGLIAPVDEEKGKRKDEAGECEGFVGFDLEGVVRGLKGFGERDEVEEDGGDGGGDGELTPAGPGVRWRRCERSRENGERGDAVEEYRNSEPKEGHRGLREADGDWLPEISIA